MDRGDMFCEECRNTTSGRCSRHYSFTYTVPAMVLPQGELLRSAGEYLGTLAERTREAMEMEGRRPSSRSFDRYARLARLSREVLEIANGD